MSTFLELTNDVLRHFNDVEFTTTTLSTATGFHAVVKDAVNDSIRYIQQAEYEWPFNWEEDTQVLVPGQADPQIYAFDADVESVDWESFTLVRDDSLSITETPLQYIDYDEWYKKIRPTDKSQVGTTLGVQPPKYVFRTQNSKFGISPIPDRAYTIRWEQWAYPSELSLHGDSTTIPSRFDHVIFKGALSRCYSFRQNMPLAKWYKDEQDAGVSKMRELLINRYRNLTDARLQRVH